MVLLYGRAGRLAAKNGGSGPRRADVERRALADDFRATYGRFIAEVVAPELGCEELVYQRLPALRCHPPGDARRGPCYHASSPFFLFNVAPLRGQRLAVTNESAAPRR